MNEQEKQTLIECANRLIAGSRSDKVARLAEIALAALTAEPAVNRADLVPDGGNNIYICPICEPNNEMHCVCLSRRNSAPD